MIILIQNLIYFLLDRLSNHSRLQTKSSPRTTIQVDVQQKIIVAVINITKQQ